MARLSPLSKNMGRRIEVIHILFGIVIVVMAVLAFTDPEENMVLFPLIFLFSAALKLISGFYRFRQAEHDRKKTTSAAAEIIFGILILGVGIISIVSIWR